MELDSDTCYHALKTHDARFDGAFFVGVSSTGIYCRTVCTAKTPKRENCTFYPSAFWKRPKPGGRGAPTPRLICGVRWRRCR